MNDEPAQPKSRRSGDQMSRTSRERKSPTPLETTIKTLARVGPPDQSSEHTTCALVHVTSM